MVGRVKLYTTRTTAAAKHSKPLIFIYSIGYLPASIHSVFLEIIRVLSVYPFDPQLSISLWLTSIGSNISPCVSHNKHRIVGISPGSCVCIWTSRRLLRLVFFAITGASGSCRSQCTVSSIHLLRHGLPRMLIPLHTCRFTRGFLVCFATFNGFECTLQVSTPSKQNLRHCVPFAVVHGHLTRTYLSFLGFICSLSCSFSSSSFCLSRSTCRNSRSITFKYTANSSTTSREQWFLI